MSMYKIIKTKNEFIDYADSIFNFLYDDNLKAYYGNYLLYWFYEKVYNEIETCRVIILVVEYYSVKGKSKVEEKIVGVSILKILPNLDSEEKICSFKVHENFRNRSIGSGLLKHSFGFFHYFKSADIEPDPIITVPATSNLGDRDIMCRFLINRSFYFTGFNKIDENKVNIEFNKNDSTNIILSIKSFWANEIIKGTKKVEFRRKNLPKNTNQVIINSTGKFKGIVGYFTIDEIVKDSPENLWNKYKDIGSIDKTSFFEYYNGVDEGYAILIKEAIPIPTINPSILIKNFVSPQFYKYV